jgi:hypothetical protein
MPYAGYGMNAGIADAVDLCWQLAAHLNGWAGVAMLDAYEAERQPITDQVSRFAMDHARAMMAQRGGVSSEIEDETPRGQAARAALAKAAYDLNVQQYCCAGLNFGYYYDTSPIIAYDGEIPPPYSMGSFTPSTVPGARAPHLFLRDGRSLYDAFGPGYTLLRFDHTIDVAPLLAAAEQRKVPLALIDLAPGDANGAYPEKLVLVRPDQHIAWRGQVAPDEPDTLIARITGAAAARVKKADAALSA